MDGWITIGTKLDNKQLEKDMNKLEKDLNKFKNEEEKLLVQKKKLEIDTSDFEKTEKDLENVNNQLKEYEQRINDLERKRAKIPTTMSGIEKRNIVSQEIEDVKTEMQPLIAESEQYVKVLNKGQSSYEKQKLKIQEINEKLSTNRLQQEETANAMKQTSEALTNTKGITGLTNGINQAEKGMKNILKDVVKWGLAILSIRGAYSMIRQASSTLAQYDKQYATDMEYIRYALTMTIAPLLKQIVVWAMQLLQIINLITSTLFGVNLFANSSADAFKNAKNNLSGAVDNAKELKNQLQGFDEMNIMQDTSNATSGIGTNGSVTPSIDLSSLDIPKPQWLIDLLDFIVQHKGQILDFLVGCGTALALIKLGLGGIKALGIGVALYGILESVRGLKAYLDDPTLRNLGDTIKGIGLAVVGIGVIVGGLPVIVTGVLVTIVGLVIKYWEEIYTIISEKLDWLWNMTDLIEERFGLLGKLLYENFLDWITNIVERFDTDIQAIQGFFNGLIEFIKGVFTGDWEMAWNGLKDSFTSWYDFIYNRVIQPWVDALNMIIERFQEIGNFISEITGREQTINVSSVIANGSNSFNGHIKFAKGGIINLPGRGVSLGNNVVGGESGAEGVIPLTDSQQMALLGESIGRYITINANIVNSMNGRVISRELQKINSQNNFAYNN